MERNKRIFKNYFARKFRNDDWKEVCIIFQQGLQFINIFLFIEKRSLLIFDKEAGRKQEKLSNPAEKNNQTKSVKSARVMRMVGIYVSSRWSSRFV